MKVDNVDAGESLKHRHLVHRYLCDQNRYESPHLLCLDVASSKAISHLFEGAGMRLDGDFDRDRAALRKDILQFRRDGRHEDYLCGASN